MRELCIKHINNKPGASRFQQTGDMLLESIVALGIVGIVAMGPAYIASRSAVAQRHAQFHAQAVSQLKSILKTNGASLCDASPAPSISVASTTLATSVTCSDLSAGGITVNGVDVVTAGTPIEKSVQIAVTSQTLFGGYGTIVVSQ